MKWTNKGHEFDELGNKLKDNKRVYIYGETQEAYEVYDHLKFIGIDVKLIQMASGKESLIRHRIKRFTELLFKADFREIGYGFHRVFIAGKQKNEFPRFTRDLPKEYVEENEAITDSHAIILISNYNKKDALNRLKQNVQNSEFVYDAQYFMRKILPIFMMYSLDKVYCQDEMLVVTSRCSLNCEKCIGFMPYTCDKEDVSFDDIKKNIDSYFQYVDYVGLFHLTGGEPSLHKDFSQILDFVGEKYGDRIYKLETITNGAQELDTNFLQAIKRNNVILQYDNYTEQVPRIKKYYCKNIELIKENGIWCEILMADYWIDMFPPKVSKIGYTNEEIAEWYDKCPCDYMAILDGKLCNCNYNAYAVSAELITADDNDFFDLTKYDKEKRMEFLEFRQGYSENGGSKFCRFCNGFPPQNNNHSLPAVQAQGLLKWSEEENL